MLVVTWHLCKVAGVSLKRQRSRRAAEITDSVVFTYKNYYPEYFVYKFFNTPLPNNQKANLAFLKMSPINIFKEETDKNICLRSSR